MQARSMRVDPKLYDRLTHVARQRGTSITYQMEMAIRHHVSRSLVEDELPTIRQVVTESLEAAVTARIDEMKERLAALLARNAMDTAVLYLSVVDRWSPTDLEAWRKRAVQHVRGRGVDPSPEDSTAAELASLHEELAEARQEYARDKWVSQQGAVRSADEIDRLRVQVNNLQAVATWMTSLLKQLEEEWGNQGLLGPRKSFQALVQEFEKRYPRPQGA